MHNPNESEEEEDSNRGEDREEKSGTYRRQSHGPSDGLPEEKMINESKRERDSHSEGERETDTHISYTSSS